MKTKAALNWLIIVAAVAIAATPVIGVQFRLEAARWHLAAATNALPLDDASISDSHVDAARQWVPELESLRDYWLYRTERALLFEPAETSVAVQAAIASNRSNVTLGFYAADILAQNREFAEAVEVLEQSTRATGMRNQTVVLNQLAYFRALAVVELEQALADINLALEQEPDNEAMRDTRAWVLFQMGKPLQALEDAQFAVESSFQPEEPLGWLPGLEQWLEKTLMGPSEPRSGDKILTQREAGPRLWNQGALIYHRAKILEALQRTDQAEADFQWLRDRHLPTDDTLY